MLDTKSPEHSQNKAERALKAYPIEISIVVPVYNEVESVSRLMNEINAAMRPTEFSYEVICIDDGSTDGSFEALSQIAKTDKNLRVLRFRKNSGQTAAFDAGFTNVRGRYVVTMDADLQNDPKDIPPMIQMLRDGYDFVSGWRKDRKDAFIVRKIPSRIANRLIKKVTKTKLHDQGCSLKVYRREITDELRLYGEMHRFISVLVQDLGANIGEYVVNHRAREAGQSKYGLSRTGKVVLDLLTVWFFQRFKTKPIYIFGGVGLVLSCFGVVFAALTAWDKFFDGVLVHNNPLLIIGVMCGIIGVQFLAFGLISEIIIRTYYESRQKTPYLISDSVNSELK